MVPAGIVQQTLARTAAAARRGRHRHRRRQLLLPRRHRPGRGAQARRDPLRRLRHQRRRVGPRARLLPDDRRRGRARAAPRPDLQDHRPRRGLRRADAGTTGTAPPSTGYLHCGPNGAGHFVKMVHNGIEYGMMAAIAEGLSIIKHADVGLHQGEIDAETTPLRDPWAYQYDDRRRRGRRGVAPRLRRRLVAGRPDRRRAGQVPRPRGVRRSGLRLRRGPVDRARRDRRGRARPVITASLNERFESRDWACSPARCCPRCATSSAATRRRRPEQS